MPNRRLPHQIRDAEALADIIARRLDAHKATIEIDPLSAARRSEVSAVLFLLSPNVGMGRRIGGKALPRSVENSPLSRIHLILNKRSPWVRQAGDLCCPGGGVTPLLDRVLAGLLTIPHSPLSRWPDWRCLKRDHPQQANRLALLFATALREGFEEMRLNPLGLRFLGPLPVERLVVFSKEIYPFVGWLGQQRRFRPNWEVASLVYLPLQALLDPNNYARLQYRFVTADTQLPRGSSGEMPCYVHRSDLGGDAEVLWGATYRIVMRFLERVFDFQPPPATHLPVVKRRLDDAYINGKG
ncbi:MAG: hypothetical protein QNJ22_01290 [Desulfosarcinaceae bacterium]|nr:hypothetical protein [Desulfosarcinaceae bacterium]